MPKYLLAKHYRGGPEPHRAVPPMDQWAPEDAEARLAFLTHVIELLEKNGEYVDAQALTPACTWGAGCPDSAPVTTDGPPPGSSDLVAGWYLIDVESHERAVELAAYVSSEPGPGDEPLYEWIDVRGSWGARLRAADPARLDGLTRGERRAPGAPSFLRRMPSPGPSGSRGVGGPELAHAAAEGCGGLQRHEVGGPVHHVGRPVREEGGRRPHLFGRPVRVCGAGDEEGRGGTAGSSGSRSGA